MEWYVALMIAIIGFPIACGIAIGIFLIVLRMVVGE